MARSCTWPTASMNLLPGHPRRLRAGDAGPADSSLPGTGALVALAKGPRLFCHAPQFRCACRQGIAVGRSWPSGWPCRWAPRVSRGRTVQPAKNRQLEWEAVLVTSGLQTLMADHWGARPPPIARACCPCRSGGRSRRSRRAPSWSDPGASACRSGRSACRPRCARTRPPGGTP